MAIKTFTTGEVLTAADTNTYLANAGLDYITSQTVSSTPVSSVTITNAFPSTHNAFRLIWIGGTMASTSGDSQLSLQVGNAGTFLTNNYYQTLNYVLRASNTTARAAGRENAGDFGFIGGGSTTLATMDVTLHNVNRTVQTFIHSPAYCAWPTAGFGTTGGFINDSVAYSDVKILVSGIGTMSNGRIYSYGFRTV